jgi:hypothetical protein
MRVISTKTHGLLDYFGGLVLIASPWLFDFYVGHLESWLPITLGILLIIYSACTRYELGLTGQGFGISLAVNLYLDVLFGVILIVSPLLFDFGDYVDLPHFAMGFLMILISIITDRITSDEFRDYAEKHKMYYITD